MLRRQARLRREYLYRKSVEEQKRTVVEKKRRLKTALEDMTPIPTDLQREALDLQKQMKFDDEVSRERLGLVTLSSFAYCSRRRKFPSNEKGYFASIENGFPLVE